MVVPSGANPGLGGGAGLEWVGLEGSLRPGSSREAEGRRDRNKERERVEREVERGSDIDSMRETEGKRIRETA